MARKTVYLNHEASFSKGLDGQTSHVRLNAQVDLYKFDNIPFKFIALNLNGTAVAAAQTGQLAIDHDDVRGWFLENVEVLINVAPDKAGARIEQDSLPTTVGTEATSSSTGITVNESLGTFGPVPTANIGGGIAIGSSFSRNLCDIKVINRSSENQMAHEYRLASSKGAPYDAPKSLIDTSAGGQLSGADLFQLPDIAIANLPIISQGIFLTDASFTDDVALQIQLRVHLRKVEKTFHLFWVDMNSWSAQWTAAWRESLPLSGI